MTIPDRIWVSPRIAKANRAKVAWQTREAKKEALLRRCHDSMSRREPDGVPEADWDQLLKDIEKEIGNG